MRSSLVASEIRRNCNPHYTTEARSPRTVAVAMISTILVVGAFGWFPHPIHPLVVHFPVALAISAIVLDLAAHVLRRSSLAAIATWLAGMAAVMALPTVATGFLDLADARRVESGVVPLEQHLNLGIATTVALLVAGGGRALAHREGILAGRVWWAYTILLAVAAAMVTGTAYFGGVVVYEHGVGTEPVMRDLPELP